MLKYALLELYDLTSGTAWFDRIEETMMLNKFDSPMVKVETRKFHGIHHHSQRGSMFGEFGDVVGIMLLCITAYALFLYYMMPANASHQYGRIVAELSYHWRHAWYAFEYQLYTAYLPYLHSLLQNMLDLWPR